MDARRRDASKVPPTITALFWFTKLVSTAMGEAVSDSLVKQLHPDPAVALGFVLFAAALGLQFWVRRYIVWVYWLAVAAVAVFGTMAADVLHIQFGIPYPVTTAFFALVLAAVFIVWNTVEKTLSIHSVNTPRRELFYWLTVSATFALGTAAGDLLATPLGLGYFSAALVFIGLIAIPALGYRFFGMNAILAFWFAYVVTRPIGASFADWMSKPPNISGLGWGDVPVALGLMGVFVVLVAVITLTERRRSAPARAGRPAGAPAA
ncbi:MAG: hypothetical protein ACLPVF_11595 [Acidimicrobiales bacterium]